jgi:hypothetical protein
MQQCVLVWTVAAHLAGLNEGLNTQAHDAKHDAGVSLYTDKLTVLLPSPPTGGIPVLLREAGLHKPAAAEALRRVARDNSLKGQLAQLLTQVCCKGR